MDLTKKMGKKSLERLSKEDQIGLVFDLINSFSVLKKPYESALFIQDLLTATEIRNLAKRLRIAKLLVKGGMSQRDVSMEVDVSLATVGKVNMWLERSGDGLRNVIKKLPEKMHVPKNFPRGPIEFHLPQTLIYAAKSAVAGRQDKIPRGLINKMEVKRGHDNEYRKEISEQFKKLK
jgi:uncharacterized protein YerC